MGNINSRTRLRGWSGLEFKILVLIIRKIQRVEDFFAFRAVCVAWRSAATKDKFNGNHQLPWLVQIQEKNIILDNGARRWKSGYIMQSTPIIQAENIESCCLGWKGWVLVVEKNGNMYLLHVFSQVPIRLPNKNSLKNREFCRIFVDKAALSSNPSITPSDYTLMIAFASNSLIAFWRPGDESFTQVQFPDYEDMICFNGLFYVVRKCGFITVFDVKGTKLTNWDIVGIARLCHLGSHNGLYLVESAGELLIVARLNLKEGLKFRVFVLIQNEWWEVVNIGSRAIFIGRNTSFSVDAFEVRGCGANHIYFTDHGQFNRIQKQHHMGIYNLFNGKVVYSHCGTGTKKCSCYLPPLWLTPTFF